MKFKKALERKRVALKFDPALRRTKSEFKEECDVNNIIAKYRSSGVLPESSRAAAMRYGDFSQTPTFQEMHNKVIDARLMFAGLPAAVRDKYGNDPGLFLADTQTEEGQRLLVKHGLAVERKKAPSSQPSSSSAGQAESAGTEPAQAPQGASNSKKGKSDA